MVLETVELGTSRGDGDGCRRYRPIAMSFDTRSGVLTQEFTDEVEPAVAEQWRRNKAKVRMAVLAEHGTIDGEQKIDNFTVLGSAPWSIAYDHNEALVQVRSAFTHGDFYPALVGASALGERIFNHLILDLRDDYVNHKATTRRVRAQDTFTDWGAAIDVLSGWGVISADVRAKYLELETLRHAAVHFNPAIDVTTRDAALRAIHLIQDIIAAVFVPMGGPPTFIAGTSGASFIALEAESQPFVKRILIPGCALVSPCHGLRNGYDDEGNLAWVVIDDVDYSVEPLTDSEFAAAIQYQ